MASRKQRVAALGEFKASEAFRRATSIRYDQNPTRKERAAALAAWKKADNLRALTVDGSAVGLDFDLGEVEDVLNRLVELAPDIIEELDAIGRDEAFGLEDAVRAIWPVDTGFSKSQWDTMRFGEGIYAVVNMAVYAALVKRAGSTMTVEDEIRTNILPRVRQSYLERTQRAVRDATEGR